MSCWHNGDDPTISARLSQEKHQEMPAGEESQKHRMGSPQFFFQISYTERAGEVNTALVHSKQLTSFSLLLSQTIFLYYIRFVDEEVETYPLVVKQ